MCLRADTFCGRSGGIAFFCGFRFADGSRQNARWGANAFSVWGYLMFCDGGMGGLWG